MRTKSKLLTVTHETLKALMTGALPALQPHLLPFLSQSLCPSLFLNATDSIPTSSALHLMFLLLLQCGSPVTQLPPICPSALSLNLTSLRKPSLITRPGWVPLLALNSSPFPSHY